MVLRILLPTVVFALVLLLAHLVAQEQEEELPLLDFAPLWRTVQGLPPAGARRLSDPRPSLCPSDAVPPEDLHGCLEGELGEQLLADPGLEVLGTGAGDWGVHVDALISNVSISWGQPGARVRVPTYPDPEAYKVLLHQTVALAGNTTYELCVQAGADGSGNELQFAVDDGPPNFTVPGGLERSLLDLGNGNGSLAVGCFRFATGNARTADGRVALADGRVTLDLGKVLGGAAVCQASLRRCGPAPAPVVCPANPEPPSGAWKCPAADMGPELLAHHAFPPGSLGEGAWGYHRWEADGAAFEVGVPGARVTVRNHSNSEHYEVQLFHEVELNASDQALYELCVQASANESGSSLRLAVDTGLPLFEVPGALDRAVMRLKEGELTTSCFRFVVDSSASQSFRGRVDLEFGSAAGEVSVCQASLRRCHREVPQALSAVRRCYLDPLETGAGCSRLEVLQGTELGLNEHSQETTGKRACLRRLREVGGNTFSFKVGGCELWACPSRGDLLNASTGEPGAAEVFSELCDYGESDAGRGGAEKRAPVFVKLWEWNFADVARECEEYLGPNGFDAVQVAPVMEHIIGPEWFTKYQPVSFRLDSRSGSASELRDMVRRCRAVGVSVVVDVVLNHVAKPCDAVREVGTAAETPCRGFAFSGFGNRRFALPEGRFHQGDSEAVGPESFHHLPDDALRNCAVDPATFQCPDSDPPNDCTMCDFYGLPDWKTGLESVRALLGEHLEELHDMGVTMIRLDAASYVHVEDLATIINRVPWDYVFQEWWRGIPEPARTLGVGNYRDIFLGRRITEIFIADDMATLPELLNLTAGIDGIPSSRALYPLTFHDQRSLSADRAVATYKNGLEFHQQQKFLLAWPGGGLVRLWGGFGWTTLDDGPPGCNAGDERCQPTSVFGQEGEDLCVETPVRSPLDIGLAETRRWVCEHRWEGVAGLVGYRKACFGLPVSRVWSSEAAEKGNRTEKGDLAYSAGDSCFVAIQRKGLPLWRRYGGWDLEGLETGLPAGSYCDVGSLRTRRGWTGARCPREVVLGQGGVVLRGEVPEGDLLAIHVGARLGGAQDMDSSLRRISCAARAVVSALALAPLALLC